MIVTVGPFYDKATGVDIEGSLTITNERITLTADTDAGSAPTLILDNVTGATSGTANDLNYITSTDAGLMQLELAAADTNRLGRMFLTITDAANHVPVFHEFMVLPAVVYDALILGTDLFDVSVTQILGTAVSTPATAGTLDVNLKNIANAAVSTSTAQLGVNTVSLSAGALTATAIAADAITDAKVASDVTIASVTGAVGSVTGAVGSVTGAVGSVTGNVGGNVTGSAGSVVGAVGSVTGNVGGNVVGSVGSVVGAVGSVTGLTAADVGAIKTKTDALPSDPADESLIIAATDAIVAAIAALNNLSAAQVNAEVVDVIRVDTIPELAQAIPAATPTVATALMLLYHGLRDAVTVTSSSMQLRNDAGTVIAKKALTDDGVTYTEAEMVAGP